MARGIERIVLHAVTDDAVLADADFLDRAKSILSAGADRIAIHVRGPRTGGRTLFEMAAAIRRVAESTGSAVIVNDRIDVALAADAHGVQLGGRSLSIEDARRMLGPDRVIGASLHSIEEGVAASASGANYVIAGTIWPSSSHPGGSTAGVELIRLIASSDVAVVAVVAIGGVTADRVRAAKDAGARGVAAIGGLWRADDPAMAVKAYLQEWR